MNPSAPAPAGQHPHAAAAAFDPPPWLRHHHLQTFWANYAPRGSAPARLASESRQEDLETEGDRLRLHWWSGGGDRPVLVVLHGLTGCAMSANVLGVATKAAAVGFDVVRVDLRNASGNTPSIGIGHAGRSEDLRSVIDHVRARRPGRPLAVVGFSLGGNVALKAAGEYGDAPPPELCAVVGISVPIDLDAACHLIDAPHNWPYRTYFLRRLERTLARRAQTHRSVYRGIATARHRSLRAFDGAVVAPLCGFRSAEDYYARSSALGTLTGVRVPTLLIQAQDDPFIPFASYRDPRLRNNPAVQLVAPAHGGHAGFYSRSDTRDADRFWSEHRAVEFCAAAVGRRCAV